MELDDFKLKHLDLITGDNINYMKLMTEMFDYKHTRFNRVFNYRRKFKQMFSFIKHFQKLKPEELEYKDSYKIKKPTSIDEVTFIAMMELNMFFGNEENDKKPIGEIMTEVISIACYSANVNKDFDIDSYSFEKFKILIKNEPAYQMIGLYNWVEKSMKESNKLWGQLFFNVEVADKDYDNAGGARMKPFNVINSIRSICEDFNLPYKDAWQMTYSVTQANSLSKSTAAHIQDSMAKLKEARMRAQQKVK